MEREKATDEQTRRGERTMPRAWFPIVLAVLALDMMTPRAWGWRSHPAAAPVMVTPAVAPTTMPSTDTSEHSAPKPLPPTDAR
jgi:hypothetical protein